MARRPGGDFGGHRQQPVTGAILGGAAGGAAGVLTDEDDVDLGDPVWKRGDGDDDDDDDEDGNLF